MIRATFAGFATALTALQSNSKKLDVTLQNISNMYTEGYTRQNLKVSELGYTDIQSHYSNSNDIAVGYGVSLDEVQQVRDQFLDISYRDQYAKVGYNNITSDALKSMQAFLDETNMDGIRNSFDAVQTALTTMQDTSKVQDPVYQGQFRSTVEATANLLNNAAEKISTAETNEYHKIDGTGTDENGYVQTINNLLQTIGDLNDKIYKNEILGQKALELKDARNKAIDDLSQYIPISVSYYNEDLQHAGKQTSIPNQLRIDMTYTVRENDGTTKLHTLNLIHGTSTTQKKNYGSVEMDYSVNKTSEQNPLNASVKFKKAEIYENKGSDGSTGNYSEIVDDKEMITNTGYQNANGPYRRFATGSLQASLDMLSTSSASTAKTGTYYGYDYYMDRLDSLAETFAYTMNKYNYMGNTGASEEYARTALTKFDADKVTTQNNAYLLLVNRTSQTAKVNPSDKSKTQIDTNKALNAAGSAYDTNADQYRVTAANIAISNGWMNGTTKLGLKSDSSADSNATVLNMIEGMTHPHEELDHKSFSDYMANISTTLSNDQKNNTDALTSNKQVLSSIQESKDEQSGVSLDEEAANMMTYVSSYNAAAKLMNAFDETLQSLLSIAG
ncbi:MAG: flagellar hook-associated protein FlgK [Oribacterium sp.]|nr:flagellar hook-associated protein FlgK [Oribacterium sp.]